MDFIVENNESDRDFFILIGSQRFHFRVPFPPNRNSMLISLAFPKILDGKSLAPHSRRYPKMIWGLERCLRGVVGG